MKIATLCGSIRKESSNYLLLKAAEKFLSDDEFINLDLSLLPFFDPNKL